MTVAITSASKYSTKGEMAYEVTYSEGTTVRAVVAKDGWVRTESRNGEGWNLVGKPYIVKKDKKRNAERIIEAVNEYLKD